MFKQVHNYKVQHHYGILFMQFYRGKITQQELLDATAEFPLKQDVDLILCSNNEQ